MGNNQRNIKGIEIQEYSREKGTGKRSILFCKNRCQLRNLPKNFGKWQTVYIFYRRAYLNGPWDKIQKVLVKKTRESNGKNAAPTLCSDRFTKRKNDLDNRKTRI